MADNESNGNGNGKKDDEFANLLRSIEDRIKFSLSHVVNGRDSELERRIDMQRVLATQDKPLDHANRITDQCKQLTAITNDIQETNRDVERFLCITAPSNPIEVVKGYVWNLFPGQKEKSMDSRLLAQQGNIYRLNIGLAKLISSARTQLDASRREYVEYLQDYETVEDRQRHYQPLSENEKALHESFGQYVQRMKRDDPQLARHHAGKKMHGDRVEELQHRLQTYDRQHSAIEHFVETHTAIERRLWDRIRRWELFHAFSVPFEQQIAYVRGMMTQLIAQEEFAHAERKLASHFTSYAEQLR
ncbi:hypothetical protein HY488_03400, partial [Candidatus Woesearchaeota archaeon]|nr:hypothetical protein [Candidatus Woesearchaeota archaeon]